MTVMYMLFPSSANCTCVIPMLQDVPAATINATENSLFFNYLKMLCVKFSGFDFKDKGQAATLSRLQYCALRVVQQSNNSTVSIGFVLVLLIFFLRSRTCREPVCCNVDGEVPTRGWRNDIPVAFTLSV